MGGVVLHAYKIRLALVVVLGLLLAVGAIAIASPSLPIVASTPKFADQMTNIDVLRQEIKNYYGDSTGTGTFAADSNYAQEAAQVAADGGHWLAARANAQNKTGKKAILLDVDDTTLATYNYEIASNWAFNSTTNGNFVTAQLFPPVPGMVDMVKQAAQEGYAIIFLTGRPASQESATLGNLTSDGTGVDAGYPAPTALPDATQGGGSDGIFTKPPLLVNGQLNPDYPQYLIDKCGTQATCNTDEYKSATRQYIESLGYEIIANFGDQFSDFSGGFEDRTFKLPNPSYFLP
jgi:predicted secreted acid phosphatase